MADKIISFCHLLSIHIIYLSIKTPMLNFDYELETLFYDSYSHHNVYPTMSDGTNDEVSFVHMVL
jgi:hypothetical protein